MANNAERRQKLFETYAANYSFYFPPDGHGKFFCPICESPNGPESTRPETLGVSVAHVYPESCGGKLVTLTCKRCNETLGTKYDSQLTIEHRGHADIEGRGLAARVYFEGGSVGVRLNKLSPTHFHHTIVPEWTNPEELEAFKAHISAKGRKCHTTFKWIHTDRHNAAVLHSAYLALFRHFGYEYIGLAATQWIRDILLADQPPSDPFIMTFPVTPDMEFDTAYLFASGLVEFDGNRFLCVVLPSPQPDQIARIVILPGIGDESAQAYRRLLSQPEATEAIQARYLFEFDRTPEPRLADRRGGLYFRGFWERKV